MKLSEIGIPNLVHDQFTVTSFCGSADAGAATTPPITAAVAITPAASPLVRVLIMEPPYGAPRLCCSPGASTNRVQCRAFSGPVSTSAVGGCAGRARGRARRVDAMDPRTGRGTHDLKDSVELYERRGVGREFGPRDYGP